MLNDRVIGRINGDTGSTPVTVSLGIWGGEPPANAPRAMATTDSSGAFTATFTADLGPFHLARVEYAAGSHHIYGYIYPKRVIGIDTFAYVEGYATPSQLITATAYVTQTSNIRWSGTTIANWPHGDYYTDKATIEPDDVVEVDLGSGAVITMVASNLTARTDTALDRVTGACPPNKKIRVWAMQGTLGAFTETTTTADASGNYTATFSGFDLRAFHGVYPAFADDAGNEVFLSSAPPRIQAYTRQNTSGARDRVRGFVDAPSVPYTITLYDVSASTTYIKTGASDKGNSIGADQFTNGVAAGDVITLQTATWTGVMTVANISGVVPDTANDRILGNADIPGWALVRAEQWNYWAYPAHGWTAVTTTVSLPFTATFTNFDVRDGGYIRLSHYDTNDNLTYIQPQRYFQANLTWNNVNGWSINANEKITGTLHKGGSGDTFITSQDQDGDPYRFRLRWRWQNQNQWLEAGDTITITNGSNWTESMVVPNLTVSADEANDRISGTAPKSLVYVSFWRGDLGFDLFTPSDGYIVDTAFSNHDLQWGDWIATTYQARNGNLAQREFPWPQIVAHYGPNSDGSRNVWGEGAGLYSTVHITVSQPGVAVVGATATTAGPTGSYDTWNLPTGVIVPNNQVTVDFGNGYVESMTVLTITAEANADTDVVTVTAPVSTPVSMNADGPNGWWDSGSAYDPPPVIGAEGYVVFDLGGNDYDIVPGTSFDIHAQQYHGHNTQYSFSIPAPHLRINKEAQGTPAEGGNLDLRVEYWNDGDAPAENTIITDTLEGMTYITDTSPFTHTGSGPVVWHLGDVPANSYGFFDIFAQVTAVASSTITNTARIATSNPYDQGDPGEKESTWPGHVEANDTRLNVSKWAWTGDPAPGHDFVWATEVCNNGSTSSSEITLTDTLPISTTLVSWWGLPRGWTQVISNSHQLAVSYPSLPDGWCGEVYLRFYLDANASFGTSISNTVTITATNDIGDDNSATNWVRVSQPHTNLYASKSWNSGQLVPGGEIRYNIQYRNNGNLPVANVRITDTLPVSTTFSRAWRYDDYTEQDYPVTPIITTTGYVVWDLGTVDNGTNNSLQVALQVNSQAISGTVLTNTVEISPQPDEDAYYDNVSTWVETLRDHGLNLRVSKTHNWQNNNTQLYYRITFENVGDQTLRGVWITDTYPISTTAAGSPWWNFRNAQITVTNNYTDNQWIVWISEIRPDRSGRINFNVNLDPNARPRWYTNTIEIDVPTGDVNPADNTYQDVAFSGEVNQVELRIATDSSDMWGQAQPGVTLTVTTAYTQIVIPVGQPGCSTCWSLGFNGQNAGPVYPGDTITVEAGSGILPVVIAVPDPFIVYANSITDTVWGRIDALDHKLVEVDLSGYGTHTPQTDGDGNYSTTFYDVPRGGNGEVRYRTTIAYADVIFHRPFQAPDLILRVNYRDEWVETRYEPGHTIWITLTDSGGNVKATSTGTTGPIPQWGGDSGFATWNSSWWPSQPDIVPGDWIYGALDNVYTSTVRVGTITGNVDAASDRITGTITANWYTQTLAVRCEPWGGPGGTPSKDSSAGPNGAPPYSCQWTEWDVLPRQDIAVWYYTPDANQVGNVFHEPAADVSVDKYGQGQPAPGGNYAYRINYHNYGDKTATSVVITDVLPTGLTYITDTSGFSPTLDGSSVIWSLGSLDSDTNSFFDVFVSVDSGITPTTRVTNSVEIATSDYDTNPGNNHHEWWTEVITSGTRLNVGKNAWTGDPAPGQDAVFNANVCNNGPTASSRVYLTDTLNVSMTLRYWWGQTPGWTPVISNSGELVVYKESLSNGQCDQVFLRVRLDAGLTPGTQISNTVVISASNDLTSDDNQSTWWGNVGNPRTNLYLDKQWNWGQLVPGSEIRYNINYNNNGNLPVTTSIRITDTLPMSTTFNGAWRYDNLGQHPVVPVITGTGYVVWQVNGLDNGYGDNFEIALKIDNDAFPGTVLTNCATIAANVFEDDPYDNTKCVTEMVRASGTNLRVTKFANWQGGPSGPGSGMQYNTRIENVGTTVQSNVTITDTYPVSMTLNNNWNVNYQGMWWWSQLGNQLVVTFSMLMPGQIVWLNMWPSVPAVPSGTLFTNTVEITTPPDDVNPADNLAVNVMGTGPDLSIEKWLTGGIPKPGQLLTYTLHFSNKSQGWWTAGNVWVTDTLPAGLEFVTATQRLCGGTYFCQRDPNTISGNTLAWNNNPMGNGWWNDILVTVRITDTAQGGDVLTNTAKIASDNAGDVEPYYDNNTSAYALTVLNPRFEVGKVYQSSRVAGTPVTYTLTVTNTGTDTGTNARLIDWLPDWVTYGGGGDGYSAGLITWTIPSVAPNNGTATRWFSGTLSCSANAVVTNQYYRVDSSDQGVTSTNGLSVTFTTLAPTLNAVFNQSTSSAVVSTTFFFTDTSTTNGTAIAARTWSFGEGSTASGQSVNHTYRRDGTFTVQLTITDTCGYSQSQATTVTVSAPSLVAAFDQNATSVVVSTTVRFTDTSTTNVPPIVAWEWDFGDGSAHVLTPNASHLYMTPGIRTVRLTVTDTLGYSGSHTATVTVSAPTIAASFDYMPKPALIVVSDTVYFTDTSTTNVPPIVGWLWTFGDGALSAARDPSHRYTTVDTYTVSLLITDSLGYTATQSAANAVVVRPACEPVAGLGFTYAPAPAVVRQTTTFTATYTSGVPAPTFSWNFDGGAAKAGPSVAYTFTTTGTHTVALTATNTCGATPYTGTVNVEPRRVYLPVVMRP